MYAPVWPDCTRLFIDLVCLHNQGTMAEAAEVNQNLPPEELALEFETADLGQRVEGQDLVESVFWAIIDKIDENDLIGIQVIPNLKWPRKVQILCGSQGSKDQLTIRGLDIYHRHIQLTEPGLGVIKVEISNAPLWVPNEVIKNWVAGFCTVAEFRNERVTVQGRKRNCRSGNIHAYVKMLKKPLPPSAKLKHGDKHFEINVWHYAQTHIKCRFCSQHVLKGHVCDRAPSRRCFNCGSGDHQKRDCPVDRVKVCYRCGSNEHLARDCRQLNNITEFPLLGAPVKGKVPHVKSQGVGEDPPVHGQRTKDLPPTQGEVVERPSLTQGQGAGEVAPAPENPEVQVEKQPESDHATRDQEVGEVQGEGDSVLSNADPEVIETESGNKVDQEEAMEADAPASDLLQNGGSQTEQQETSSESSLSVSEDQDDATAADNAEDTQFFDAFSDESSLLVDEDNMHVHVANVALVGGSNCKEMKMEGDEDISLNTTILCEEGLKIAVTAEKLEELSPEERERLDVVVMHVGTDDFPLEKDEYGEHLYMYYVAEMRKVRDDVPNVQIVMSSVIPQAGEHKERTNRQIKLFNDNLKGLGSDELEVNLNFCNNSPAFIDGEGNVSIALYSDSESVGVHINSTGKEILTQSLEECIKSVFFREKLVAGFSPERS